LYIAVIRSFHRDILAENVVIFHGNTQSPLPDREKSRMIVVPVMGIRARESQSLSGW